MAEASEHKTNTSPVGTKGYSGNPGGRPKMPEELKEAFKALAPQALKTLADVMNNGEKDSDRVKASEIILDRGYGKASQPIDATLEGAIQVINVGLPKFVKDDDQS